MKTPITETNQMSNDITTGHVGYSPDFETSSTKDFSRRLEQVLKKSIDAQIDAEMEACKTKDSNPSTVDKNRFQWSDDHQMMRENPNGEWVPLDVAREIEEQRDLLNANIQAFAAVSYELASYANESLPKNTPEFLEGLFERIQQFEESYTATLAAVKGGSDE